jgi:hypothetical protein
MVDAMTGLWQPMRRLLRWLQTAGADGGELAVERMLPRVAPRQPRPRLWSRHELWLSAQPARAGHARPQSHRRPGDADIDRSP